MRVVFMGTPAFAVPSLEALVGQHEVVLVVSQPDRPAGRGMGVRPSPVAGAAREGGLPLVQPARARDPELLAAVGGARPDLLVVAAYGQILPESLLGAAPFGALNVHASLLPRWRGASPIAAAILAGDAETGVSIMRVEAGLDTGPVLLRRELAIEAGETAASLGEKLARLGAEALLDGLGQVAAGTPLFEPQDESRASYAPLVRKADGNLDWDRPAAELERAIRAFDPWPGVRVPMAGEQVRLLRGHPVPGWYAGGGDARPGSILEVGGAGITVMAADSPFLVEELQPPGRRAMSAPAYARGRRDLGTAVG